jgi:hypothetical protein
MKKLEVQADIRIASPNTKVCWQKQHTTTHMQRRVLRFQLCKNNRPDLPCRVTLTRCGKRHMDSDNVVSAFKAIRDEVADYLIPNLKPGQADSDSRIEWVYAQKITPGYSIVVTIDPLDSSS